MKTLITSPNFYFAIVFILIIFATYLRRNPRIQIVKTWKASRKKFRELIYKIIENETGCSKDDLLIPEDTIREAIALDELESLQLFRKIENKFKISFPDDFYLKFEKCTFNDLINWILKLTSGQIPIDTT